MYGATAEEVTAKLGKIQQGADPPQSEAAVISLLNGAGFGQTTRFSEVYLGSMAGCREDTYPAGQGSCRFHRALLTFRTAENNCATGE